MEDPITMNNNTQGTLSDFMLRSALQGRSFPDPSSTSATSGVEKLLAASEISSKPTTLSGSLPARSLSFVGPPHESAPDAAGPPRHLESSGDARLRASLASITSSRGTSRAAALSPDYQGILSLLSRPLVSGGASLHPPLLPMSHSIAYSESATLHPLAKILANAALTYDPIRGRDFPGGILSSQNTATLSSSVGAGGITLSSSASSSGAVRKDQIEAALRSKPQRGRKRENLNDVERMELTRTRNREHAKSTRIRKKARYDELLDAEKRWKEHLHRTSLNEDRKAVILKFVSLRERALRSCFDETAASGGTSGMVNDCSVRALRGIMCDDAAFLFGATTKTVKDGGSWQRQLEGFDNWLVSKVARCLGKNVIPMLTLSVQGGFDHGVAFDALHSAYVPIDLTLASLCLMRCLVRFDFDSVSGRQLACVHWSTLQDATGTGTFERIDVQQQPAAATSVTCSPSTTGARDNGESDAMMRHGLGSIRSVLVYNNPGCSSSSDDGSREGCSERSDSY